MFFFFFVCLFFAKSLHTEERKNKTVYLKYHSRSEPTTVSVYLQLCACFSSPDSRSSLSGLTS